MADLLHPQHYQDGSIGEIFRSLPPVSWQPAGYWAVVGYEEACQVLTQPDVFSSAFGTGALSEQDRTFDPSTYDPANPPYRALNLCDPPAHTALREHLEDWIAAHPPVLPADVFAPLRTGGDVADSILRRLPRHTLMAMLEVSEEDAFRLQDVGLRIACAEDSALASRTAYSEWRSAEDELSVALGQVRCGLGAHLDPRARQQLLRLLLLASLESSTTALASLLLALSSRWDQARERRSFFVEEVLRLNPPLQRFARLALRAYRLGNVEVQAGQRVVVFFAPANRGASHAKHLSFGAGPHRCPGAGIARKLLRSLLDACLELPGPPRLAEPPEFYWSSFQLTPRRFVLLANA